MVRSAHPTFIKKGMYLTYANLKNVGGTSIYSRGHGNAMPLQSVALFFQIGIILRNIFYVFYYICYLPLI